MKTKSLETMRTMDDQLMIMIKVPGTKQNEDKINNLKGQLEKGKDLIVDIKVHREKRSLDANAYCWILCQKIAEKIGNTKEFVYKRAIKQVGQFEIVPIKQDALQRWMEVWQSRGIGWQSEVLEDSKTPDYVNTINYYGSSVYNTKEMSLLLEEIVLEAKELGIDTMTEHEQKSLLAMWESRDRKGV